MSPVPNSRKTTGRNILGTTLVVARVGIARAADPGRGKPVPYGPVFAMLWRRDPVSQPVVDTLQNSLTPFGRPHGTRAGRRHGPRTRRGTGGTHGREGRPAVRVQQVRSDLRAEIRQVRTDLGAEIQQLRTDLSADIQAVDHKVDLCRARIDAVDGKIDSVHSTLKLLSTGVGLALAFLAPAASAPTPNASPGSPAATAS